MYNRIIKWSICLLTFLLPLFWLPFSFEVFEFNKQFLLFFLVSLAFLAWIAKMVLVDKELKFKSTPLDIPILVFLFVAVLGTVFSADKSSSLFGFYGRFSDGLIGLISLVLFYFLITNNVGIKVKSPALPAGGQKSKGKSASQNSEIEESDSQLISVNMLMKVFTWSVSLVILTAYLSFFGVWSKLNDLLAGKFALPDVMLQRTFNPVAGSMEGLAIFLAVFVAFLVGKILTNASGKKKGGGTLNYLFLAASLILLILVDFNTAWLILAISSLLFVGLALWRRAFKEDVNKLLLPIILAILSFAFIVANTSLIQSSFLGFQLPREQVLEQGDSWKIGFGAATEGVKSGFLGSGIGTYHYDFSKFKSEAFNENPLWQIRFDRPGSHFAEVLGTMGFLGMISWLFLIGFFIMISYFFLQKNQGGIPLLMGLLVLLVGQVFFYQNTILAFSFWLFLALSVVLWQKPVNEKTVSFKDFPELSLVFSALLIVLGIVVLGMFFFAAKFYMADINYVRALGQGGTKGLEQAAELNPFQPQYKIVLSRDYLNKVSAENQKPTEERNQEALSVYVQKAISYAKGGQIGTKYVKGATELSPDRVAAWETMGMVYRDIQGIASGALEWAVKSFEKAVSLEPANPVLRTELGKVYLVAGNTESAVSEFNKAIELRPSYVDAPIQLALLKEAEGNIEEAVAKMESLTNSYPFNVEVLFQLGRVYFNAGKTDSAIAQFEKVIVLMPNHSNAHYSLGVAYQKKGQIQKAIAEFEKVLELNPGNMDVRDKIEGLK